MTKTLRGLNSEPPAPVRSVALLRFSVGGHRLAARVEEVGGVSPWPGAMPVPSEAAHVTGLLRQGDEVLTVYDFAARLGTVVDGAETLCLVARHRKGPLAIRIDAVLPTLHGVQVTDIEPWPEQGADCLGRCRIEGEMVPVYALSALGGPA